MHFVNQSVGAMDLLGQALWAAGAGDECKLVRDNLPKVQKAFSSLVAVLEANGVCQNTLPWVPQHSEASERDLDLADDLMDILLEKRKVLWALQERAEIEQSPIGPEELPHYCDVLRRCQWGEEAIQTQRERVQGLELMPEVWNNEDPDIIVEKLKRIEELKAGRLEDTIKIYGPGLPLDPLY
jgi:hypothetical protein